MDFAARSSNKSPAQLHEPLDFHIELPAITLPLIDLHPTMAFFRITLIRSAIGLPSKSLNVLKALGLRKRMNTVFHPVSPQVAGQIMRVKELIAVSEVDEALTKQEVHEARRPDPGFYVESRAADNVKQYQESA